MANMNRFIADMKQRQWARDIEHYDRMARIKAMANSQPLQDMAERNMREIRDKYPQHFKDRP